MTKMSKNIGTSPLDGPSRDHHASKHWELIAECNHRNQDGRTDRCFALEEARLLLLQRGIVATLHLKHVDGEEDTEEIEVVR